MEEAKSPVKGQTPVAQSQENGSMPASTNQSAAEDSGTDEKAELLPNMPRSRSQTSQGTQASKNFRNTRLAKQLQEVLAGKYEEEEVESFLDVCFEELERIVGNSVLQEDQAERVLAIRCPRVMPIKLCCLTCATLGLYYFVRPHDDLAVLLLQKSGHVLMVREADKPDWGAEMKFLLVVVLIKSLFAFLSSVVVMNSDNLHLEEDGGLQGLFSLFELVGVAVPLIAWIVFMVCIWQHRQRGYGARVSRRFKCAYISAAQYVLHDERDYWSYCLRRTHQHGSLRLFFGRYPPQAQMDASQRLGKPGVEVLDSIATSNAPVPAESIPEQPGTGGRRSTRCGPVAAFMIFVLSCLLNVSIMLGYLEDAWQIVAANTFCHVVNLQPKPLMKQLCHPDSCRPFFNEWVDFGPARPSNKFCRHVTLVEDGTVETWTCNGLAPYSDGCCGGCVLGSFFEYLGGDNQKEWRKTIESFVGYFSAFLALSTGGIVINLLYTPTPSPQAELDFQHDIYQPSEGSFLMKGELALEFMHHMFHMDGAVDVPLMEEDRSSLWSVSPEEAPTWHAFFQGSRRLTDFKFGPFTCWSSFPPEKKVCVPEQCLGLGPNEKVLKAWKERTYLSDWDLLRAIAVAFLIAVMVVFLPQVLHNRYPTYAEMKSALEEHGGARRLELVKEVRRTTGSPFAVILCAFAILPGPLLFRFVSLLKTQCCIIVTSHRVFGITYRPNFLSRFPFGWSLRMDIFRHDSVLYYGRMRTSAPSFFDRLCSPKSWRPGEIVVQSIFGILRLPRTRGSISEIYDMVATRMSADVKVGDCIDPDNDIAKADDPQLFGVKPGSLQRQSMGEGSSKVVEVSWESVLPHDPRPVKTLPMKGAELEEGGGEQLLVIWSFAQEPRPSWAWVQFNDIVVTTDSIRLSSSRAYKPFDCKTCLCWCFPYHALKRLVLGYRHLPETQSFLNFTHMQAFSTEYTSEPPVVGCSWPAFNVLCNCLTRLSTFRCFKEQDALVHLRGMLEVRQSSGDFLSCHVVEANESMVKVHYDDANISDEWLPRDSDRIATGTRVGECFQAPRLSPAQVSLWLMVLPRYAQEVQPDLVLCQRPCYHSLAQLSQDSDKRTLKHRLQRSIERSLSGQRSESSEMQEAIVLRQLLNLVLDNQPDEQKEEDEDPTVPMHAKTMKRLDLMTNKATTRADLTNRAPSRMAALGEGTEEQSKRQLP